MSQNTAVVVVDPSKFLLLLVTVTGLYPLEYAIVSVIVPPAFRKVQLIV